LPPVSYTQADPIGLRPSLNLFAYVDSAPTVLADPRGLAATSIGVPPPSSEIAIWPPLPNCTAGPWSFISQETQDLGWHDLYTLVKSSPMIGAIGGDPANSAGKASVSSSKAGGGAAGAAQGGEAFLGFCNCQYEVAARLHYMRLRSKWERSVQCCTASWTQVTWTVNKTWVDQKIPVLYNPAAPDVAYSTWGVYNANENVCNCSPKLYDAP
jgi:hypothetical protein